MIRGKILVIEDDIILRNTIKDFLEIHDFEIIEVGTVADALPVIYESKVDLIICDVVLPDYDGKSLLEIVRGNEFSFDLPFIFLSGMVSDDDVRSAMNNGADDYLKKPFSSKILLETVESRISLKRRNLAHSNKKLLSIIDNHFNENFLNTLSNIFNGAYTISTATEIMNNQDFEEAIGEIYSSSFRLFRNTKNLILYAHFSKSGILPHFSGSTPLFISDIVTQQVDYYNKILPIGSEQIIAHIDFVPFPKYLNGKVSTEILQYMISELIDNSITHDYNKLPPVIKLTSVDNGFIFRIMNTVPDSFSFSLDKIEPFAKFGKIEKVSSLGLGLYNCKRLCDALGFKLTTEIEGCFIQFELHISD